MVHIKVTKGLNIPIEGAPSGPVQPLPKPELIGLSFEEFPELRFKLLVKQGDIVKIGSPLAEDKSTPGRLFTAPAAGTIKDIRRGPKRSLQCIVIEVGPQEEYLQFPPIDPSHATKESILERLLTSGCFSYIRSRPFNLLANPEKLPRSIFVKALSSAPFNPCVKTQIDGFESEFQAGLNALTKLTTGKVHLVHRMGSTCHAFTAAKGVEIHTAEGPHPVSNHSVHIQAIDPIRKADDVIWTLNAWDVVAIGSALIKGRCHVERVVGIGGPGIVEGRSGFFKARLGYPVQGLILGRLERIPLRLINGDPLMGKKVSAEDFLGPYDFAFSVIPENISREFLHFMRLGADKYTFSKAYISGHFGKNKKDYSFTTSLHGEHRPFIDSSLYDKVMPLDVPTMLLVKAVMAEDFELAETLGILEVDPEDFALPTFVCPSKMEMTEIMKTGIQQYAKEILS